MLPKQIDLIGAEGFTAHRIAPPLSGWPLDPFLHIEFRHYHGAKLPPRPKAGRSCVHYVLEDSPSPLLIRNSLGERHVLQPGEGLISVTGRGLIESVSALHNEQSCFSILAAVNLSEHEELISPKTMRLTAFENPLHSQGYSLWSKDNPFPFLSQTSISRFTVKSGEIQRFGVPSGHNAILVLHRGKAHGWREADHCRIWDSFVEVSAEEVCEFWLFSGPPLQSPLDLYGPFSMSDRLRNRLAALEYRRGDWGSVSID